MPAPSLPVSSMRARSASLACCVARTAPKSQPSSLSGRVARRWIVGRKGRLFALIDGNNARALALLTPPQFARFSEIQN
jgi:hypothetical protein